MNYRKGYRNSCRKWLGILLATVLSFAAGTMAEDEFRFSASAAAALQGKIDSVTDADSGETENPFDRQDDTEVPYDRTRWKQPEEWNTPTIDPRDYQGGIMLFCDKIGLEPEDARSKIQRVYFSIIDATVPVNTMKFHIFYDTRLKIVKNGKGEVLTAGKAVTDFTTGSAMYKEGQLAFYAYSREDIEVSRGSLFTVDFLLPENAMPGDVYPIGFAYVDDGIVRDSFINAAQDTAGQLQMTYVFTRGIYNGYIRIHGEKPVIRGDYNIDCTRTVADAVLLARFLAEDETLTDVQVTKILNREPDYDGSGSVTVQDISALLSDLDTLEEPITEPVAETGLSEDSALK